MATFTAGAASVLVDDLTAIFGNRLRAIVSYGPHFEGDSSAPVTCLALVTSLSMPDLAACAARARHWARANIAAPLIVPEDEFRRSLDVFPLEYGEIIRAHAPLVGDDPFAGVAIAREDIRRACEMQAKSHLLHLREEFIESGGSPAAVAQLVRSAAPAFAALLRNAARLSDVHTFDRLHATREGGRIAGLSEDVVTQVLALDGASGGPAVDAAGFFPSYLAAVEHLARVVDTWRV